jgi:predicted DNA-binding transcriptional regulator
MPARVSQRTLERIVHLIERAPGIRTVEVAHTLGLQHRTTRSAITTLVEAGRVTRAWPAADDDIMRSGWKVP